MDFDNNIEVQKLVEKLKLKIKAEDFNELELTDEVLKMEIYNALLEYYNDRHFSPTDEKPFEGIYGGIIIQLALSAISKYGAEGENYHSEGGIIRTYDNTSPYPLALTRKIIPLAKGVDI